MIGREETARLFVSSFFFRGTDVIRARNLVIADFVVWLECACTEGAVLVFDSTVAVINCAGQFVIADRGVAGVAETIFAARLHAIAEPSVVTRGILRSATGIARCTPIFVGIGVIGPAHQLIAEGMVRLVATGVGLFVAIVIGAGDIICTVLGAGRGIALTFTVAHLAVVAEKHLVAGGLGIGGLADAALVVLGADLDRTGVAVVLAYHLGAALGVAGALAVAGLALDAEEGALAGGVIIGVLVLADTSVHVADVDGAGVVVVAPLVVYGVALRLEVLIDVPVPVPIPVGEAAVGRGEVDDQ